MSESSANILQFRPLNRPETFTLRLSDDSMIGAGLPAGSLLTFIPSADYLPGECVAVETPDGLFVKYIYPAPNDHVLLYGAHRGCRPRVYRRSDVEVSGVLAEPNVAYG